MVSQTDRQNYAPKRSVENDQIEYFSIGNELENLWKLMILDLKKTMTMTLLKGFMLKHFIHFFLKMPQLEMELEINEY